MADEFQSITNMNRVSVIRNARTASTGAMNGGRQASYKRASEMGIKMQKEWIAQFDERTRDSHRNLDGQRVDWDKKFSNGLEFPGDSSGTPAEVYNCRCGMRAVLPKVNDKSRQTYREWEQGKNAYNNTGRNGIIQNIDIDDLNVFSGTAWSCVNK